MKKFGGMVAAALVAAAAAGLPLSAIEQPVPEPSSVLAKATFAGGCFWSMEHVFDELAGVVSVTVGYSGGSAKNPSYQQVELGVTGHAESVQVVYDPEKIEYEKLLDAYWHNIDPTDGGGQFCDHGTQYRPVIFYNDEVQKQIADASKKALEDSHRFKRIATQIVPASTFWRVEPTTNISTRRTRLIQNVCVACGRDPRLATLGQGSPLVSTA